MQFPEMIRGVPRPLTKPAATGGTSEGDLVVRGTPVCQGRVQATARVVTSLSDAAQIQVLQFRCGSESSAGIKTPWAVR